MTRKYPLSDLKILYGKSSARCNFENCRKLLVLEPLENEKTKQLGKIGHIIAHSSLGPRSDPNYPKHKLDTYENWILVCPTCHDQIDIQEVKYTTPMLREIKAQHEKWINEQLDNSMSEITFAELEIACKAIASGTHITTVDFQLISPEEKIKKNNLSPVVRSLISMGLSRSAEVSRYLSGHAKLDPDFPQRLKNGFKEKYLKFKNEMSGDALFMALQNLLPSRTADFAQQSANLAILCHLFELCEIFER
jgi:hypothetical protein